MLLSCSLFVEEGKAYVTLRRSAEVTIILLGTKPKLVRAIQRYKSM